MDTQKNKNFWHDLYLDDKDNKLTSINFIETLREDYTKYTQHWLNDYIKKEKIIDDIDRDVFLSKRPNINKYRMLPTINKRSEKRVSFKPEFLLNRSPLTIIDGPWGSGKTHFLNETFSLIKSNQINIDKDIKTKVYIQNNLEYEINCIKIHRFISIDAWKYSAANDIITDFLIELSDELSAFYKWSSTTKKIKKSLLSLFNNIFIPWINRIFKVSFQPFISKEKNINVLNKYVNKTTLVVIDNIERLGKNAWEIIRIIQRLSILKNLIFVLPMNLIKFNELCQIFNEFKINSKDNSINEWNIYKYINMPCYLLKQNYYKFFLDIGFNEENSIILDKVFNLGTKLDGSNYSIRELNNVLRYKNIDELKTFNKIKLLVFIKKNEILYINESCDKYIKNIIQKEIDEFETLISSIIQNHKNICENPYELQLVQPFDDGYFSPEPKYRYLSDDLLDIAYYQIKNKLNSTSDIHLINILKNHISTIENHINKIKKSDILQIVNKAEHLTSSKYYDNDYYNQEYNEVQLRRSKIINNWHNWVISAIFLEIFK